MKLGVAGSFVGFHQTIIPGIQVLYSSLTRAGPVTCVEYKRSKVTVCYFSALVLSCWAAPGFMFWGHLSYNLRSWVASCRDNVERSETGEKTQSLHGITLNTVWQKNLQPQTYDPSWVTAATTTVPAILAGVSDVYKRPYEDVLVQQTSCADKGYVIRGPCQTFWSHEK